MAAAAHCASTSSAFLGLPHSNVRRRHGNSCRFAANARTAPVSATLDKETAVAAAKPRRSRNRRPRKATKSESTAVLAPDDEPAAEARSGGGGRGMVALDDVNMSSASSAAVAERDPAVLFPGGPMCEFAVPGARDTTVLVVGATSRIGRIVVRKLMLRGYNVKALVRRNDPEVIDMLPRSVDIVVGDVGDPSSVQAAVSGCNKVIYCATARSTITGDLNRVDNQGVRNVTKAFQDYYNQLAPSRAGKSSKSKLTIAKFKSANSERMGGCFLRYDGLLLSVGGNGRSYVIILETGPLADTSQSKKYFARMNTKVGFCRVRVPFSAFRPVNPQDPPLEPFLVHTLTIRFEPKKQIPGDSSEGASDPRNFELKMEFIKALPSGQETDIVLVSCTGSGIEANRREQVLKAKKAGEDALRRSGLGYTIVRPGPLQEEPGGRLDLRPREQDLSGHQLCRCGRHASKRCTIRQQGTRALMCATSMSRSKGMSCMNWWLIYPTRQTTTCRRLSRFWRRTPDLISSEL
ncbi:unnamed protein product [Urochloa decumbens]|uniref:NAD(P)-binding domain-containing protein n=1 Tax=Urochloa decumbens TaxID=240449 RepID=A0ABC9A4Y0_9POAL